MTRLIKNGNIVSDEWKTLTLAEGETPQSVRLPVGPVLVPLPVWRARRTELIHREYEHGWPLGVWLAAEDGIEEIARDIDDFTVIAIRFDRHNDGLGYAKARTLRRRHGYSGELRAIGHVPRDDSAYQHQAGFDAFALRPDQRTGNVLSGLFDRTTAAPSPTPQYAAAA
ncbi:MAG TPA: DUF934 domain-containing protein [Gallionella sp.]